jgi:hypothetical protein
MLENHWLAADQLAARLGLPQRVRDTVEQTFERWDGKGAPKGARGEQILMASRLVNLAERMLACSAALAPLAAVAVQHHERLDGSGYPRGLSGGAVSPEVISRKTASHHVEHIYAKTGTTNRALASLFAANHGLASASASASPAAPGPAGSRSTGPASR